MRDALFRLNDNAEASLQTRIREMLISAVMEGHLTEGDPIPSTRKMARRIGVSRNTVTLAYQALVSDGFLKARDRSGFYVDMEAARPVKTPPARTERGDAPDWAARLVMRPGEQDNISKPVGWSAADYPFIYGQVDANLFPIAEWRECVRQAMGKRWLDAWTEDRFSNDDPDLIKQIRKRLLPRRGILAGEDEVLVTLGAQNALFLVASLLIAKGTSVVLEDPGYPDVRNMVQLLGGDVRPVPVDADGIVPDNSFKGARVALVTPSHHFPTTVTMGLDRRKAVMATARDEDCILIEDDYEFETNFVGEPFPALKSFDQDGRVIYVGSLSKSLMPGLRLGFVVAPKTFIDEMRALRRLMLRHPPGNNQRAAALFLSNGHFDALAHRIQRTYRERWRIMGKALDAHLPGWSRMPSFGGSSYWLTGPDGFDAEDLAQRAYKAGIVIEPGRVFFNDPQAGTNTLRLGFSSIAADRIGTGIEKLAGLVPASQRRALAPKD